MLVVRARVWGVVARAGNADKANAQEDAGGVEDWRS